ncbi:MULTISPECIES: hypothetical protein [unclassified Aeromonas]|uniref:phage head spike fiber domain-containing protein n=1 Tax=unclassified Aeromonas TaxID=257493 RepID=UPI0035273D30
MAGVWKRDGTVAVTNGNKKVTGTGTTFADTKNGVAKGHLFCITSGTSVDFYEVDYVVSNTELYLVQAYRGTTATGKAYEVITTFSDSIPEFARRMTAMLGVYQGQSDVMQLLLTSDAASVTVTAPDGTSHTLVPWKRVTSEGEGQAARAKLEADKAASSAEEAKSAPRAAIPYMDFPRYGINGKAPTLSLDFIKAEHRIYEGMGVGFNLKPIASVMAFSRTGGAVAHGPTLMESVADNVMRVAYQRGVKLGGVVEPQSTNLITYSEDLSNTAWQKTRATVEVLAGASPRGNPAYKIVPSTDDGAHYIARVYTPPGSGSHVLSFYAKSAGYTGVGIYLKGVPAVAGSVDIASGAIRAGSAGNITADDMGDGWWRISITTPVTSGVMADIHILALPNGGMMWTDAYQGNGSSGILVWGIQLEAASIATSYMATTDAQVTRPRELLRRDLSSNLLSRSQSVVFVGRKQLGITNVFWSLDDGADGDKVILESDTSGGLIRAKVFVAGAEVARVNGPSINTPALRFKAAVAYDNASKRLSLAVNGVLYSASVGTSAISNTINRLSVGCTVGGFGQGGQPIEQFAVLPSVLADAELIEVTK